MRTDAEDGGGWLAGDISGKRRKTFKVLFCLDLKCICFLLKQNSKYLFVGAINLDSKRICICYIGTKNWKNLCS